MVKENERKEQLLIRVMTDSSQQDKAGHRIIVMRAIQKMEPLSIGETVFPLSVCVKAFAHVHFAKHPADKEKMLANREKYVEEHRKVQELHNLKQQSEHAEQV